MIHRRSGLGMRREAQHRGQRSGRRKNNVFHDTLPRGPSKAGPPD
jgi:hypothetical protein